MHRHGRRLGEFGTRINPYRPEPLQHKKRSIRSAAGIIEMASQEVIYSAQQCRLTNQCKTYKTSVVPLRFDIF